MSAGEPCGIERSGAGLRDRIELSLRAAEANRSADRAQILRLLVCAIRDHDAASESGALCDDGKITGIIQKMIRQRQDSMAQRDRAQSDILESFLPLPLNDDQMRAAAESIASELGARGLRDLGRCVREMKERFPGRVESGRVNDIVRRALIGADRPTVAW